MEITFLGTNGWYDSAMGNTLSILITTEECNIILDAGSGLAKAPAFIDQEKQSYLFISHFHLDHVVGLHSLARFEFSRPLIFLVRNGSARHLRRLVASPYTLPLAELPFQTRIMELPKRERDLPFSVQVLDMVHPDPTIGMRLTLGGRTVAFCPDTGYCANCVSLARNADLLIAECAALPGEESRIWPHLNPETAARIAREAGVGKLVLTHFDAARYVSLQEREAARSAARSLFQETEISVDGGRVSLAL